MTLGLYKGTWERGTALVYNEALAGELAQKLELEPTANTRYHAVSSHERRLGLVCFLPSGLRGVSRSSLAITCRSNCWHLGSERVAGFCSNLCATNAGDFSLKLNFQLRYDGQYGHFLQQLCL